MESMTLPDRMAMIRVDGAGGPETLRYENAPLPVPAEGEVMIRVRAAGINRPDLMQRSGLYPPPPGASPHLGLEVAGEVATLGAGVTTLQQGEKVTALTNGGGYAEYCAVPATQCLPYPEGFDDIRAAALPETFFTVWANVFMLGRLQKGEKLLVHGGSGGIGSSAIQLASTMGATVYATAGGAEKCAACRAWGAVESIDYKTKNFADAVAELTGKKGVDVILDMIGGSYLAANIRSLAAGGRLVTIALQGGAKGEADLARVMTRRLTLTGSTLRPRSKEEKAAIAQALKEHVWPLLSAGRIGPHVHAVFPLHKAEEAHRLMESGAHTGKIILTTDG
ncbi:NAD(P)H-quinone oxidoreductase [Granulibacter bethesdensis]|uniref:Quinone oxidoreductase n=1 Tax=Granulibacter bethesdensis (strain ATCC BAA-1260 / CGDNIH1) TaxID=391165 RepID=Q0BSF6_GRABC|nr:Quinone oxidoreductase [Granulibacter bethesdensis CGDNIH1]APH52072.1 Quinone oxidoreductase [Granulibacter bethesdensis]APH64763.1 Quinone oxidoreductase [Granulibacter bethesdensis]